MFFLCVFCFGVKHDVFCSIVRQEELMNNIKNQVYVIDTDHDKYKRKIVRLIQNHDSGALMKQLFWKPHVVLSMIVTRPQDAPLFMEICNQFGAINGKFVLFFLNCLFFHSFVMLEEPDNEENKLLKKYFNWGLAYNTMGGYGSGTHFYHLPTSLIVSSSSAQSSIVNLILKKEYLKVFTFNGDEKVCAMLMFVLVIGHLKHFFVLFNIRMSR